MKKRLIAFFIILFLPFNIFAYSKNIIPGGESIGIDIDSTGLTVVGFYKVNGEYIARNNIKIGDEILKINNKEVNSIDELTDIINENIGNSINVEVKRNGKIINTKLNISIENGIYKTGLYVKDSIKGIGTLTYIDPVTKIYGALGHEINYSETNTLVEIKDGKILDSVINSINKSRNGSVGSKNARIIYNEIIGNIKTNTNKGIYGLYLSPLPNKSLYKVATFNEIEKGKAKILTVVNFDEIKEYEINIIDKYPSKKNTQKAFSFEITSDELLSKTGGIVQGMSGSPIIQNGKIIGAVTNVVVDNVKYGYGISIITMLEEGDKIEK